MLDKMPQRISQIYDVFQDAGFEIFLVGGCVRDLLLNRPVKDWDLTTNATPEEILKLFPKAYYDNTFGTVGIPLTGTEETEHQGVVEVTTYRTEHGYADRRHPEKVAWGKTIEEDLSRRDFTINAMAMKLTNDLSDIVDPYNGQEDLNKKIIRAVGDPAIRFKEDALRLMRAIRFATQLGFSIEEQTLKEVTNDAPLLQDIAHERIRDELMKILASDYPYEGIMLLKNTNLIEYILPELLEGINVSQERPGRHHKTDVFTHNVMALKLCPSSDPLVRFATLIHDIGKPRVAASDQDGYVIFYNHEIVGAKMAYEIANRLKFSKKEREKIVMLVRWHMFSVDEHQTDAAVRRFIRRVGVENVKDMVDLRIGDRLGSGIPESRAESWRLSTFKERIENELKPGPFSIKDLAINGNDLMQALDLEPGRKVGELLQKLFEEVDEDLSKNTKEYLLQRIKELD